MPVSQQFERLLPKRKRLRPGPAQLRLSLEQLRLGAGGVADDGYVDVAAQVDALQGKFAVSSAMR